MITPKYKENFPHKKFEIGGLSRMDELLPIWKGEFVTIFINVLTGDFMYLRHQWKEHMALFATKLEIMDYLHMDTERY